MALKIGKDDSEIELVDFDVSGSATVAGLPIAFLA
jgi:hypothetical protein